MEFESIEVLFNQLNLDHIKNMLMSAYHSSGAGRPPFDPLGLLRFKIMYFMKGYRSQRALEREIRVDGRARELCGFEEKPPSHSTIVRFENRIGAERLKKLVGHLIDDLVGCGFIKGLKVVLDSKPLEARSRRDPEDPSRGLLDAEARLGRGARGMIMGTGSTWPATVRRRCLWPTRSRRPTRTISGTPPYFYARWRPRPGRC